MTYAINIERFLRHLLPWPITATTATVHRALLKVFAKGLQFVNDDFAARMDLAAERVKFHAGIKTFEKRLNDVFDPTSAAIYIEDTAAVLYEFIYYRVEERADPWIYTRGEIDTGSTALAIYTLAELAATMTYIVHVPTYVAATEEELRAEIDRYNAVPRTYTIEYF